MTELRSRFWIVMGHFDTPANGVITCVYSVGFVLALAFIILYKYSDMSRASILPEPPDLLPVGYLNGQICHLPP